MAIEIVELKCPNCGAPVSMETKVCDYCASPIVIRTINNNFISLNEGDNGTSVGEQKNKDIAMAFNFLKAKLYDRAIASFESVITEDFNSSDAYFYAAVASLKGKRAFLASASAIKKAEEFLQTAIAIEPKGIYYYLWAYIRLDHHFKKFYKASPNYKELYDMAINVGLSLTDVNELYSILDVEKPSEL